MSLSCQELEVVAVDAVAAASAADLAGGTSIEVVMTGPDAVVVAVLGVGRTEMDGPDSWVDIADTRTDLEVSAMAAAGHTLTVHAGHDSEAMLLMRENWIEAYGTLEVGMVAACVQLPSDQVLLKCQSARVNALS